MRGKVKDKKEATTSAKKHSYLRQTRLTASQQLGVENEFSNTPLNKAEFKRKLVHSKKAA